jgi:hypothetical protein
MKKIVLSFLIALLALTFVVVPVLADGGEASVTCSDITVTDDAPPVGTTITYHGTVTIVANASSTTDYWYASWSKGWTVAGAESHAWYTITDPDGNVIATDSCTLSDSNEGVVGDVNWWGTHYYYCFDDVEANAGQIFDWSVDIPIELVGDYTATQGGEVTVYYGGWTQTGHCEWSWCGYVWVWDEPVPNVETLTAEGDCPGKVVTSCLGGAAILNSPHAVLTVILPGGKALFFGSDGWDDPTDQVITFSDGTWQVDIAVGTLIELDGKWHMLTTLIVDEQGGVTMEYGKTHTEATDIGLSQPITITKIGE